MIKSGVKFEGLHAIWSIAYPIVLYTYRNVVPGIDPVITSGSDGKHKTNSFHYSGKALDFRTKNIPEHKLQVLLPILRQNLGENFDVVWETDHLHIEYDPKD